MNRYINQCDHLGEHMVVTPDGDLCLYVEVEAELAKKDEEMAQKEDVINRYAKVCKTSDDRIAMLETEIARLRKALDEIANHWPEHNTFDRLLQIAKEALVNKEE